jgi:beta-lactamase superfamily II metal-dependent hydrolase
VRVVAQRLSELFVMLAISVATASLAFAAPPKMSIFHFDVNTGDATLIVSPDGHAVLIDAGDRGRGLNPIVEFLNRARDDGVITSLDFTIATHYDADHIGGMDEVLRNGWYPTIAVHDRGDSILPPIDTTQSCTGINADEAANAAPWGNAPTSFCGASEAASCAIIDYILAAKDGNKRHTVTPGQVLALDHGITLKIVVVNATDAAGNSVEVDFPGRRDDCAANDLSVGVLISFGDFRYLVAGDLTGVPAEKVADVEGLIIDDLEPLDMYHVNHHGANTSSNDDFMTAIHPTVAIVSNGSKHDHPRKTVIENRILSLNPPPALFLTNLNQSDGAWNEDVDAIADEDFVGFDGMIEVSVFQQSYRVFRWRNGSRMDSGQRFFIKPR